MVRLPATASYASGLARRFKALPAAQIASATADGCSLQAKVGTDLIQSLGGLRCHHSRGN